MDRVEIPILDGLQFNQRNADFERCYDVSVSAKRGVMSARKVHAARYSLATELTTLLYHPPHSAVYGLDLNGDLWKNSTGIASGISINGSLIPMLPNDAVSGQQIFIAGGTTAKMLKYDGTTVTKWGISPPPDTAVTIALSRPTTATINDCENSATWAASDCTIADDAAIFTTGSKSLKITLVANQSGIITNDFADIGVAGNAVIRFNFRAEDPSVINYFLFTLLYSMPGGSQAIKNINLVSFVPLIRRITNSPDTWQEVVIDDTDIVPAGCTLKYMSFAFMSTAAQDLHLDDIGIVLKGQDDQLGSRYKYGYYSDITKNQGNLNLLPSSAAIGIHNTVTVTGFAQPPTDEGITHIVLYRDTGQNGSYRTVSYTAIPSPWSAMTIVDQVETANLGSVDSNDNARPPAATLVVDYGQSVWMNDLSAPRRVWRSPAGKRESFAIRTNGGYFNALNPTEQMMGFAVIRGILFILTTEHIIQVTEPDGDIPGFIPIARIGPLNRRAFFVTRDFVILAHNTGIYTFDGANIKLEKQLSHLFTPESSDPRRITTDNAYSLVLGANDKRIWFKYQQLGGVFTQYTCDISEEKWVEESTVLVAHDTSGVNFNHIAAGHDAIVYDTYSAAGYQQILLTSQVVELPTVSHIMDMEMQYTASGFVTVFTYVDEVLVNTKVLSPATRKTIRWPLVSDGSAIFGQRIYTTIGNSGGVLEAYSQAAGFSPIAYHVHYDSGNIHVSSDEVSFIELYVSLYGIEAGTVTLIPYVEGLPLTSHLESITVNGVLERRYTIVSEDRVGKTCRLIMTSPTVGRFRIMGAGFSVILLGGGGEPKRVDLVR